MDAHFKTNETTPVWLRPALPADLPRLAAVSRAADTLFARAGLDLPPDDPGAELAAVDLLLLAEVPGAQAPLPVGFAGLVEVAGAAHLATLGVHPDHGRRGIGTALLERACDRARDRGYREMTLTTFRDLPFNAPWYAARGFTRAAVASCHPQLLERSRLEADGIGHLSPRVIMRRPLL